MTTKFCPRKLANETNFGNKESAVATLLRRLEEELLAKICAEARRGKYDAVYDFRNFFPKHKGLSRREVLVAAEVCLERHMEGVSVVSVEKMWECQWPMDPESIGWKIRVEW